MSPSSTFPKPIKATFTGATANDPVVIVNNTTGERITTDERNSEGSYIKALRIPSKGKSIVFDCNNFKKGWSVGDVITVSLGGTKAGHVAITLTAAKNAPDTASVSASAVSIGVLNI